MVLPESTIPINRFIFSQGRILSCKSRFYKNDWGKKKDKTITLLFAQQLKLMAILIRHTTSFGSKELILKQPWQYLAN